MIFGLYSPFTTGTSLGSHPDYTWPGALHLCPHLICDFWAIFALWVRKKPAVPHHCLKWPSSGWFLGKLTVLPFTVFVLSEDNWLLAVVLYLPYRLNNGINFLISTLSKKEYAYFPQNVKLLVHIFELSNT